MTQKKPRFQPNVLTPDTQRSVMVGYYALHNAHNDLTQLVELMPHWVDNIQDRLKFGTPRGDNAGRSSSDVSDPTLGALLSRERYLNELGECLAQMSEIRGLTKGLTVRFANLGRIVSEVELAERKADSKCCGGFGMRGAVVWGRPDCADNWLYSNLRLCEPCYKRMKRWERAGGSYEEPAQQASRTPVVAPADTEATASVHKLVVGFHDQWKDAG